MSNATENVLSLIRDQREYQDKLFPDELDYSPFFWIGSLLEQVGALVRDTGRSPDAGSLATITWT